MMWITGKPKQIPKIVSGKDWKDFQFWFFSAVEPTADPDTDAEPYNGLCLMELANDSSKCQSMMILLTGDNAEGHMYMSNIYNRYVSIC
jgi:hypothetical protein